MYLVEKNANLHRRRDKPKFSLQLWNIYERVMQDLPWSKNAVEEWPDAFNNRVSIKHPSVTKLAKCILNSLDSTSTLNDFVQVRKQRNRQSLCESWCTIEKNRAVLWYQQYRRIFNSNCYELENKHLNLLK